uniref:Uncharacterized protein n=1 Tax=Ditylenchus dipsaci TaxID=166011 RepID=A0A915CPQ8_9BILA
MPKTSNSITKLEENQIFTLLRYSVLRAKNGMLCAQHVKIVLRATIFLASLRATQIVLRATESRKHATRNKYCCVLRVAGKCKERTYDYLTEEERRTKLVMIYYYRVERALNTFDKISLLKVMEEISNFRKKISKKLLIPSSSSWP